MRYKINLLPSKEKSLKDKLVYFLLHYFRYIIVINQLVVITVFFYRFQIDQKIIDLKEEISQKKEIIKTIKPLIIEAGLINERTNFINKILNDQRVTKEIFYYLISFFPESITLTRLELNESNLSIAGISHDITHFQRYLDLLKKDKKFKTIDLKSLKKTANGYDFVLILENYN